MTNEKKLTPEQDEILKINDQNLIVAASAGSGKTTIMIDKIADYILSEKCHINELLVLTYTKSAAYEMKKKLIDKLKSVESDYSFLEHELDSIQSADVCTFDSFCQKLVKKYFYMLNIDPSFNILTEEEQIYLKNVAIKNAIQQLQQENPSQYEILINSLAPQRNDNLIEEIIFNIYNYTTSILNPEIFFTTTKNFYTNTTAETIINNHYNNILIHYINELESLKSRCIENKFDSYVIYLSNIIAQIEQIKREPSLSKRLSLIQPLETLKHVKMDELGLSKVINATKTHLKEHVFDKLYEHYISSETINESYTNCKVLIDNLLKLLKLFEKEYSYEKSKINSYDFNDIERLTINLLENEETCIQIKNTYKYIFVDEFQDANAIQEKIIFKLQNENLFFVGDTKQSIYAFRQSDPEIFLNIQKMFNDDIKSEAKTLNCNFRTNGNILNFVNEIFSIIMTDKTCNLNYAKDSMFTPMAEYDNIENEKCVSLNLILTKKEKTKTIPTKPYNLINESYLSSQDEKHNDECLFICNKIMELMGQPIFDNKLKIIRPITYKDIAILISKRSSFSKKLTQYFIEYNIPHIINSNENLDKCYDNRVLFQLLKYSLNQNDDYALTCLLTSPLFSFSDSELGEIKLNSIEEKYFYNCIKNYNVKNEILEKILNFNKTISQFIFDCKFKGIYYSLNAILKKTNYLVNISFDEDFTNRQQNILQYVNDFTNSKFNFNVTDYVLYKENSQSKTKANSNNPLVDAVQITTMHSSKGLEYPIVILPNLEQDFTKENNHICIKINKHLGIGIKNFNTTERKCSNGIFYEACKIKNKETELSEKIRLLYVAMTRAKNKLILVGKSKLNFSKFKSDYEVLKCNNYLSMIVNSLNSEIIDKINSGNEFNCNLYNNDKFEITQVNIQEDSSITSSKEIFNKNIQISTKLEKFLNKNLSDQKTNIALKNSVSSFSITENTNINSAPQKFLISEHLSEPVNKIGTLYHRLLEQINFNEVTSVQNVIDFINCNFTEDEKELFNDISVNEIYNNIVIIKKFILNDSTILKEQKFVMNIPYNTIVESKIDDKILIQGIIDLLIINKNNIILIDYKLTHKNVEQIKQSYFKQINLYELAISKQFNLPIKKYIINLRKSEIIEL